MSPPDLVGTTLAGRYRILSFIGEGGMGTVYLGEQIAMGRPTAIKVLHSGADDADTIARFRRGARNAARIDHPNVCRVFEYGDPPGGIHFLAMEFIEGRSLHDAIGSSPQGRLPLLRATRIVSQVAAALEAAHRLGIVHRDLKPGNIMLTGASDGEELVKVVDFDIAKTPTDPGDQEITELHWWVGTPVYMSPEQLLHQPLDGRSDIYSLGIVLYRIITGTLPFSATNHWAIMAQRLSTDPLTLREAAPSLSFPDGLQSVLDRALRKDPNERWSSVTEFGEALTAAAERLNRSRAPTVPHPPPGEPSSDISSAPTQRWHGDWDAVPKLGRHSAKSPAVPPEPPSVGKRAESGPDPMIPATELAAAGRDRVEEDEREAARGRAGASPPVRGPRVRPRVLAIAAALVLLAAGGWGAVALLNGRSASIIAGDPEGQLLALQQQLVTLGLAGSEPSDSLLESADSTARLVFAQSAENPDLQARAASLVSQARGYSGDWHDALEWAVRAVDLAPGNSTYQTTFARAARERLLGMDEDLRTSNGIVGPEFARMADSVAAMVLQRGPDLPALRAQAAAVRAAAHARLGDPASAVSWAQQAVDLAPQEPSYRAALADYRATPTPPPSETAAPGAAASPSSSVAEADVAERLSSLELELASAGGGLSETRAQAVDDAARLIFEENGQSPELRARAALLRARALQHLGDWPDAVAWAQRGLSLDPGNPGNRSVADSVYAQSLRGLDGRLNASLGSLPEGLAEAANGLGRLIYDEDEASPRVRASAADLTATGLLLLDDREGAIEWVRRAMDAEPGNTYYPRRLRLLTENRE